MWSRWRGPLGQALGNDLVPHAADLMPLLFSAGLSPPLTEALDKFRQFIPSLVPQLESLALDAVSHILARCGYDEWQKLTVQAWALA